MTDNGWQYAGGDIAFVTLDKYTWSIAGNLGFSATDEGVSFVDSFPTIVSGLPCLTPPTNGDLCYLAEDGTNFFGRDGVMHVLFDGPSFGDFNIWGSGTYAKPTP